MTTETFVLHEDSCRSPVTGGTKQLGFQVIPLTDPRSAGVMLVRLECGETTVDVLPTRGMGIWQATRAGIRFGWDSPVAGPVHPTWVPLTDPGGLGWLEGFDEMMVRCGLVSNGAPDFDQHGQLVHPLHGRIANLPAREITMEIDRAAGRISIHGVVEETRFHFHRLRLHAMISIADESPQIRIRDEVTNLSDRPAEVQILYHCNFGPPVLESGSRIVAPVRQLKSRDSIAEQAIDRWDVAGPPEPGFSEQVYFMKLASDSRGRSVAMLTNSSKGIAAVIEYDSDSLPCFTVWKNTVGLADGYVTGLEPGTNFPNPRPVEIREGRCVNLPAGQSVNFSLGIGMLVDRESIQKMGQRIAEMTPRDTSGPTRHNSCHD